MLNQKLKKKILYRFDNFGIKISLEQDNMGIYCDRIDRFEIYLYTHIKALMFSLQK